MRGHHLLSVRDSVRYLDSRAKGSAPGCAAGMAAMAAAVGGAPFVDGAGASAAARLPVEGA